MQIGNHHKSIRVSHFLWWMWVTAFGSVRCEASICRFLGQEMVTFCHSIWLIGFISSFTYVGRVLQ